MSCLESFRNVTTAVVSSRHEFQCLDDKGRRAGQYNTLPLSGSLSIFRTQEGERKPESSNLDISQKSEKTMFIIDAIFHERRI